jgi:hypothetical protein
MKMQWSSRLAVVLLALSTTACGTIYAQGRGYPTYPSPRGGGGGVYRGGYVDIAYQNGFDDGYRRGVDAARSGDRFDPRRERWYRSGDRGYDRRLGHRSEYRQIYRDGFTRGYERGYREAARGRRRW